MAKRSSTRKPKAPSEPFAVSAAHRVIVLHGPELYLLREFTRKIDKKLTESFGKIQRFEFNGTDAKLADVLDELRSYGLLQQHKLVVLNEADAFFSGGEDGSKKHHRKAMEKYALNPVEDATLLMRASSWRSGNLDKAIKKVGTIHKCDPPARETTLAWCHQRCTARYDADIDKQAAQMLIELIGINLSRLDTELDKLATYVGPGETITTTHISAMVGMTRDQLAWTIQDAICTGNPAIAFARVRELIDVSQLQTVPMMWSVIELMRKVHAASAMLRQGASRGQLAGPLKLWGSVGEGILEAARMLEPAEAAQLLRQAVQTDRRTKSGFGNDERSLEALTVLVADTMSRR